MIANLFTVAEPASGSLRRAFADLLAVPEAAVDVADADGDQEGRDWEAPVLCTFRMLPPGDLALELDITVEDATARGLTEEGLALGLAARAGSSVLYPSGLDLPSDYWVAVPDGRSVRCRLEAIDTDEDTAYRVDAVEEPVPDLPRARIETLPEILDRQAIDTPISDAFLTGYPRGPLASVEGRVHYHLRVWERLVRRLESDWNPSGRYREDLFRRDLESRDALVHLVRQVEPAYAGDLRSALTRLDHVFREHTQAGKDNNSGCREESERWWWNRCPRRLPW